MQETRQNRISRLLQKELSLIFQSQTRMMHGVMVSVTKVRVSPDLSICTAYLSVFPSEKGEEILKNINANEKTIRFDLGRKVRNQLRIIPELRFFLDDSLDYLERIDELLKKEISKKTNEFSILYCSQVSLFQEEYTRYQCDQLHLCDWCGCGNDGTRHRAERI